MTDHCHMSGIKVDHLDVTEVLDHLVLSIQAQAGIEGQPDVGARNGLSQPGEIGRLGEDGNGFRYLPGKCRRGLSTVHVITEHRRCQVWMKNTPSINEFVSPTLGDCSSAWAKAAEDLAYRR